MMLRAPIISSAPQSAGSAKSKQKCRGDRLQSAEIIHGVVCLVIDRLGDILRGCVVIVLVLMKSINDPRY